MNKKSKQSKQLSLLRNTSTTEHGVWDMLDAHSKLGIIRISTEQLQVTYWNKQSEALFGWTRNEIVGKKFPLIPPGHEPRFLNILHQRKQTKHGGVESILALNKNGSLVKTHFWIAPLSQKKPDQSYLILVLDTFHHASTTTSLPTDTFEYIFSRSNIPMVILESNGIISKCNTSFEVLSGYSKQEIEHKKKWTAFVASTDLHRLQAFNQALRLNPEAVPKQYEFLFITRHKMQRRVQVHVEFLKDIDVTVVSLFDVTYQHKIQKDLQESEQRIRSLYNSMTELFVLHEVVYDANDHPIDYRILDCNQSFSKVTGIPRKKTMNKLASEVYGTGEAPYLELFARVARTGEPESLETYFAPMEKHFRISVFSPMKGRFATVSSDITAEKKLRDEILKSTKHYRLLFESNPQPMWVFDIKTLFFLAVNQAAVDHYGYRRSEFLSMTLRDIRRKEDLPMLTTLLAKKQFDNKVIGIARHRKKDGTLINVELTGHGLLFEGRDARLILARDITKELKLQQQLVENEQRYRQLFKGSTGVNLLIDPKNQMIIDANRAASKFYGYSIAQLKSMTISNFNISPQQQIKQNIYLAERKRQTRFIFQHKLSSGEIRTVEVHSGPIIVNGRKLLFSTIYDITEEQRLKITLKSQKNLLESIVNQAAEGILAIDTKGSYLLINSTAKKYLQREISASNKHDIARWGTPYYPNEVPLNPDDFPMKKALTGVTTQGQHLCFQRKDGTTYDVLVSATPIKDMQQNIIGAVGTFADITEMNKTRNLLQENERDLNRAQAVAHIGSWRLNVQKNILLWSDENYRIFDIPIGTPLSYGTFLQRVHPEDQAYVDQHWNAALRGEPYDIEHRIIVNGKIKWVCERAELEFDHKGNLIGGFGTTQDITKKKLAEQLIENLAKFPEENPNPVMRISRRCVLLYANPASKKILSKLGWKLKRPLPIKWCNLFMQDTQTISKQQFEIKVGSELFLFSLTPVFEKDYINLYGRNITDRKKAERQLQRAHDQLEHRVMVRTAQLQKSNIKLVREVKKRTDAERELNIRNEMLSLSSSTTSQDEYLSSALKIIQEVSQCSAVGIRILDTHGFIPFHQHIGYSQHFCAKENWLSVHSDQCICIRVSLQTLESFEKKSSTSFGTFYTNNSQRYLGTLSKYARNKLRGVCMQTGYLSLAAVPIRYKKNSIGILHIADKHPERFPPARIRQIESLVTHIGETLHKFSIEQELKKIMIHKKQLTPCFKWQ